MDAQGQAGSQQEEQPRAKSKYPGGWGVEAAEQGAGLKPEGAHWGRPGQARVSLGLQGALGQARAGSQQEAIEQGAGH